MVTMGAKRGKQQKKELGGGKTGARWLLVQGGVDVFSALFLVGFRLSLGREGATLIDVINDPTTKFFVVGPALLTFGA